MPKLEYVLDLNAPVEKVWAFYDTLDSLKAVTPPETRVRIADAPERLTTGTRFVMWVSQPPLYVPLPWECVITAHQPPRLFVDEQGKGPFALWRHEHRFDPLPGGGTRLTDRITYEVPFGPLGRLADALFIRRTLDRMFAHRHRVTRAALDGSRR
jgi:ligand-binding SRPBCC domain-containing protein